MLNRSLHANSIALWKSTHTNNPTVKQKHSPGLQLITMALPITVLYWPVTRWTVDKFLQSSFHWHWFVAALVVVCALRNTSHRYKPGVNNGATVLLLLCAVIQVVNQSTLQIQLLSAVLLIVSIHAFSGYIIANVQWRAMKWPLVVGVALLPLDFYLEPYFGYPLRLFTATIAQLILQGLGFDALSSQSILLVENTASVVDLDCSGINSLWAGAVFYLILSWMTRLAVGARWWLLGLLLVALLLCANVARIVVLVILDLNNLNGLSEIAHTSMGAVGFASSILVVWKLTDHVNKIKNTDQTEDNEAQLSWRWPVLPLAATLLVTAAIPVKEHRHKAITYDRLNMPPALAAKRIQLSGQEQLFFANNHALAVKYQLGDKINNDSVVLVTSNWWKAQHKPDHCLQAMGFSIQRSRVVTLAPDNPSTSLDAVTVLNLINKAQDHYTAVYWFQSNQMMTADHYRRMTDTFRHPNRSWTMVSLLLSGDLNSAQLTARVDPIRNSIAKSYKEIL